jgi:hypothetical protein
MKNHSNSYVLLTVVAAAIGVLAADSANAQLYIYEPFDYTVGSGLNGQNGGYGFTGAWRNETFAASTIVAGSLAGPAGLPTSGNHALLSGSLGTYNIFRDFPNISGADGTTTWISYIGQRVGPIQDPPTLPDNPYPRGVNVGFFNTEHPSRAERATIGNSTDGATNAWSFIPTGSSSQIEQSAVPFTDLAWVVLRIDHIGDISVNDNAYMWVNPDPMVEPLIANADVTVLGTDSNGFDYSGLDYVRPFVGGVSGTRPYGELLIDELRVAGSYVSLVPEPSSLTLIGLGLGALLFRRARR